MVEDRGCVWCWKTGAGLVFANPAPSDSFGLTPHWHVISACHKGKRGWDIISPPQEVWCWKTGAGLVFANPAPSDSFGSTPHWHVLSACHKGKRGWDLISPPPESGVGGCPYQAGTHLCTCKASLSRSLAGKNEQGSYFCSGLLFSTTWK